MEDDWISRVLQGKKVVQDAKQQQLGARDDAAKVYEAQIGALWQSILKELKGAIESYNAQVDVADHVEARVDPDTEDWVAEKAPYPSGRVDVRLNREGRRITANYLFTAAEGRAGAPSAREFFVVVKDGGLHIPLGSSEASEITQALLAPLLARI